MAIPVVALIEFHHIPGQETSHASGQRHFPCSAEEMKVVWQKGPSVNLKAAFFSEKSKFGNEIVSVLIGQEDRPFLDASTHDMMENTRRIQAR
jgi:hypothetical protein